MAIAAIVVMLALILQAQAEMVSGPPVARSPDAPSEYCQL